MTSSSWASWFWFRYTLRLLAVILFALVSFTLYKWFVVPVSIPVGHEIVTIGVGDTSSTVARRLYDNGNIHSYLDFKILSKIMRADKALKAGEYRIIKGETLYELIKKMQKGEVEQYNVTLIEGTTLKQFIDKLVSHEKIDNDIKVKEGYEWGTLTLKNGKENLEGLLLPETYSFIKGDTTSEILERARLAMDIFLKEQWQGRDQSLSISTPYQALILASIVEKETSLKKELPIVAGVYNERLKKGWRLQADPTVNYALGLGYSHVLSRKDLKYKSPYNTYVNKGLPPAPIAFPSKDSIIAVLHPKKNAPLYFVADGKGGHVFSYKYDEHLKAVAAYRAK